MNTLVIRVGSQGASVQLVKKYPIGTIEGTRDPFPMWRQMHRDGPVVRSKLRFLSNCWFATSWQAASDMLRDQAEFGRDPRRVGKKNLPGLKWWIPPAFRRVANSMLSMDNDEHRRLRSLVDQAFLRSQVDAMRPRIESIADEFLDDIEMSYGQSREPIEFVSAFCRQFPLRVICEILGLPQEDRPKFTKWFRRLTEVNSPVGLLRVVPGLLRILRYFDEQFEQVKRKPRPGLLTELVQMEMDGDRLSKDELVSMVFLLLVAGHETTVHLISNGLVCLLRNPDQRRLLVSNWNLLPTAVEEVLRYTSPAQMSKPRFVINDHEFHGVTLKRGDLIIAILGAANVDPDKFENPEAFDIKRSPNPHLAYGSGVHVCLGKKLANAEAEIAIRRILERFPQLCLADSENSVQWAARLGLRTIKKLHVMPHGR